MVRMCTNGRRKSVVPCFECCDKKEIPVASLVRSPLGIRVSNYFAHEWAGFDKSLLRMSPILTKTLMLYPQVCSEWAQFNQNLDKNPDALPTSLLGQSLFYAENIKYSCINFESRKYWIFQHKFWTVTYKFWTVTHKFWTITFLRALAKRLALHTLTTRNNHYYVYFAQDWWRPQKFAARCWPLWLLFLQS